MSNKREIDLSDKTFKDAYDAILSPFRENIFITGGAGTGKSLLLKSYYERLKTNNFNVAVVSPTGVSSSLLSENGVPAKTIHSLFLLPPHQIFEKKIDMSKERRWLFKKLDYLLIDEVSMLSPSLFDHMMWMLNELKFKGNIIIFGDIMQLSPVVNFNDDDVLGYYISQGYVKAHSDIPQFYNSKAYNALNFKPYVLDKIYRQKDSSFASILSRIRMGEETDDDLNIINSRVMSLTEYNREHQSHLYLTSLNRRVERINFEYNRSFDGKPYMEYTSKGVGSLSDVKEETIRIYEDQQVICTHNNSAEGYQNGTLGMVIGLDDDSVLIETPNGEHLSVQREKWSDYKITYNSETHEVTVDEIGSLHQIGCKPAYAITIHKSEGMTLDNVYLDISSSYMPKSGIYLALSRIRSLDGLGLSRPIRHSDIKVDKNVKEFYLNLMDQNKGI